MVGVSVSDGLRSSKGVVAKVTSESCATLRTSFERSM